MHKSDTSEVEGYSIADCKLVQAELLTGQTGVRITSVPIPEMTDDHVAEVKRLISEYCVAVLPNQPISPAEHVAFVGRFDPITFTPGNEPHPDWPDIHVVNLASTSTLPPMNGFHSDTSFVQRPPSYTSLSPQKLPSRGGDTVFTNQYMAYEALSPVMQGMLAGLRLKHVVSHVTRPEDVQDPVWHPAVRTNPITGRKALYLTQPQRCFEAEGMKPRESANLIQFLYAHSQHIYAMYRHRWQPGDFVIWDNRCSMHGGVFDHGDEDRLMHRVMCQGETPY